MRSITILERRWSDAARLVLIALGVVAASAAAQGQCEDQVLIPPPIGAGDRFGTSLDRNGNGVPDECEVVGDLDGDGIVGVFDLLGMLRAWGLCRYPCPPDVNRDGIVNVSDLLTLLANWG